MLIFPTHTIIESVRFYYTHLSIRTPPQGTIYIILSNEKYSVTVLCTVNYSAHNNYSLVKKHRTGFEPI